MWKTTKQMMEEIHEATKRLRDGDDGVDMSRALSKHHGNVIRLLAIEIRGGASPSIKLGK